MPKFLRTLALLTLVLPLAVDALAQDVVPSPTKDAAAETEATTAEAATSGASDAASAAATASKADGELQRLIEKVRPSYVFVSGGSGVCVSPDGYVLTNHHVVPTGAQIWESGGKPQKLRVRMPDRKTALTAIPVAADPRGDIVLLKIEVPEGETLPYAPLGDSDALKIGDVCVAIGNPFLLGNDSNDPSVSVGVVSALGRHQSGYSDAIQIDAAVNPGNSGGPTYNLKGEVVGINGRILTAHAARYNTGAGYAIPAAQIKRFWDTMAKRPGGSTIARHGVVAGLAMKHREAITVTTDTPPALDGLPVNVAQNQRYPQVLEVRKNSDAWRAGLRPDDAITRVGPYAVHSVSQFYGKLQTWPLGSEVELGVKRGSEELTITVPLNVPVILNQSAPWPFPEDAAENSFIFKDTRAREAGPMFFGVGSPIVRLGITLSPSDADDPAKAGVVVESLAKDAAAEGKLRAGDIIQKIGERRVRYITDVADCMMGYRPGDTIVLTLRNSSGEVRVEKVTFPK